MIGWCLVLFFIPMSIFSQLSGQLLLKPGTFFKESHPERTPKGNDPADYGLRSDKVGFGVADGIILAGYYVYSSIAPVQGTLLILHGIGSCKEHSLLKALVAAENGYNAVIYDARAHGESEGRFCTFGAEESQDVSRILDILDQDYALASPYFIWGHSLGGAVGLLALADEPRLKAGVIESSFTELDLVAVDYMNNMLGFGQKRFTDRLLNRLGQIASIDFMAIKPIESARKIKVPVMIAHGENDERIKFEYGLELYNNLGSESKKFVAIPGAGHINLWTVGGQKYMDEVMAFFGQHH